MKIVFGRLAGVSRAHPKSEAIAVAKLYMEEKGWREPAKGARGRCPSSRTTLHILDVCGRDACVDMRQAASMCVLYGLLDDLPARSEVFAPQLTSSQSLTTVPRALLT